MSLLLRFAGLCLLLLRLHVAAVALCRFVSQLLRFAGLCLLLLRLHVAAVALCMLLPLRFAGLCHSCCALQVCVCCC